MSLYNFENLQVNQNVQQLLAYLNTEAQSHQIHVIEDNLHQHLLKIGKDLLIEVLKKKEIEIMENATKERGILPFHSIKSREYLSIFGSITIKRAYFWKPGSKGFYPLDVELNLPHRHHSHLLEKWLQGHVGQGPYKQAINNISDLLHLKITKSITQKITRESTEEIENFYKEKTDFLNEGSHIIIQADCKGVVMIPKERPETKSNERFVRRAKGVSKIGTKKDAVVTSDYTINPSSRKPKDILEGLMLINSNRKTHKKRAKSKEQSPRNKQVFATMKSKEKAFKMLGDRISMRDLSNNKPIYILIDGAVSLEKGLLNELYSRGWQSRIIACCLDIVHAVEYLWDASTAVFGEFNSNRSSWVRTALSRLLNSKVENVIEELEKMIRNKKLSKFIIKRLNRTITYLKNHKHMMDYKRYLKEGYPIASGAIEGACNTLVKDRTDRSGMQWTKKGAEAVLYLRNAQCNKDWEKYWNYYVQREFESNYVKAA